MKITDGQGKGYEAAVTSRGMLTVQSISRDQVRDGAFHGRSFSFGTGPVTLTSANESAVIYFVNNHPTDFLQVESADITSGPSTAGTGSARVRAYANPTTGTLLTGGTLVTQGSTSGSYLLNVNLSTRQVAQLAVRVGGEGSTVLGSSGLFASRLFTPAIGPLAAVTPVTLGPGSSVAYAVLPPTGNTSMQLSFNIIATFVAQGDIDI